MQPGNFLWLKRNEWDSGGIALKRGKTMLSARLSECLAFIIVVLAMALATAGNASAQSGDSVTEFYRGKGLQLSAIAQRPRQASTRSLRQDRSR